ncbi:MAG: phosphate/phosphite/phosphonate ABC transporter substrate-binding protein [Burkholderiales bacterium]|jgi:phosphonate transport system substrate-binding protein|uniref:phosphate/phosphite/phosphonate ABC transporter substrate-binding protein n=1 Tax=Limnobacter sp. TaxID=2003368 RepID=UPI0039BD6E6C|nr:phosphate/phosphite/phosphonate ABC transporter substrate-binding protein [Burkholderiales bacterium]
MTAFTAFATRAIALCIVTLFGLLGAQSAHSAEKNSSLRLLVVPQFPVTEIHATWSKLLDGLKKEGLPEIELVFAKDITEFENLFKAGQAELIYCNPYHMVMAQKAQGYVPMIRDNKPLTGILITATGNNSTSIKNLSDLNGKTLLFPSPNAFGASLYMRALLKREKGLEFTTKYVKTHSNVIRGVVRGEGQAGGMVNATLLAETPELQQKVTVIYETPPVPPHPIAAHPRIDASTREALTAAILGHIKTHKQVGEDIQIPNPVRADYTKDYKPLENLGLEAFLSN